MRNQIRQKFHMKIEIYVMDFVREVFCLCACRERYVVSWCSPQDSDISVFLEQAFPHNPQGREVCPFDECLSLFCRLSSCLHSSTFFLGLSPNLNPRARPHFLPFNL